MKLFARSALTLALTLVVVACSAPVSTPTARAVATMSVSTPLPSTASPTDVASPTCTYIFSRGPNCSSRVVLSYDDCPLSLKAFKDTVLAAERLDVALVMFPTGNCIKIKRFNVAYALAHGHYVFNHSITHPQLTMLSYKAVLKELGIPGVITNYGRPPFGAHNKTVRKAYAAVNMRIWTWGVDTEDWKGKSRASVVKYVIRHARAGQTVLMHMRWNGFSETALRQIKDGLAKLGRKVCRNYPGITPAVLDGNLRC